MGNQTDYFERVGYWPKYHLGERIRGIWQGIPFCGTVGNDRLVNLTDGPEVTVHLDLPIMTADGVFHYIVVPHNDCYKPDSK